MDRATVDIYDDRGLDWAASHAKAGRRACTVPLWLDPPTAEAPAITR